MKPTVRSRRLGAQLRSYREKAQLDQTTVAEMIGIKQAHMSTVENGGTKLSQDKLRLLVDALHIPVEDAAKMEELRARAEIPGWWQEYDDIISEPLQALIELEEDASWIRTYEGQVVPGLLQTKAYAERLITGSVVHMRFGDIDRVLELRMRRQKRLLDPGFKLTAIVSEMVIRQQIGGPGVLLDQLRHIMRMVREHNVTMQVVPFTADAHAALSDQFMIIQWPSEDDPEAVYVDGQTSWTIHEKNREIRQYTYAFASAQGKALPPPESLDLIHDVIKELDK